MKGAGPAVALLLIVGALLVLNARTARGRGAALERAQTSAAVVDTLTAQRDSARDAAASAAAAVAVSRERYAADSAYFEEWREIERGVQAVEADRADVLSDSLAVIVDSAAAIIVREIQAAHTEERRAWENERRTFQVERTQLLRRTRTLEELVRSMEGITAIDAGIMDAQAAQIVALERLADPPLWDQIKAEFTDPSLYFGALAGFIVAQVVES